MKILFILFTIIISIHKITFGSTQARPEQVDKFQDFMQKNYSFLKREPVDFKGFCDSFKQEPNCTKLHQQQKIDQAFRLLADITKFFYWSCEEIIRRDRKELETPNHEKFKTLPPNDFEKRQETDISSIFTIFQMMVNQLLEQGRKIQSNQARMRECEKIQTQPYGTSFALGISWLKDNKGIIPFSLVACLNLKDPKVLSRRLAGEPKTLEVFHEMALPFSPFEQLTASDEAIKYHRYLYFKYGEIITLPDFLVSLDDNFARFIYHHGAPNFTKEKISIRISLSLLRDFEKIMKATEKDFFMETPQTYNDLELFNAILLEELLDDSEVNAQLLPKINTSSFEVTDEETYDTKQKTSDASTLSPTVTEKEEEEQLPTKDYMIKGAYENAIRYEQEIRMKMVGENAVPGRIRNKKVSIKNKKALASKPQQAVVKNISPEEIRKKEKKAG